MFVGNAPDQAREDTLVAARSPRQAQVARAVAASLGVDDAANVADRSLRQVAGARAQVVVVVGAAATTACAAGPVNEVVAAIRVLRSGGGDPGRFTFPSQVVRAGRAHAAGPSTQVAAATLCGRGPGACLQLRRGSSSATACSTLAALRRHGITVSDGGRAAVLAPDGVRAVEAVVTREGRRSTVTLPVRANVAVTSGSAITVTALRS